MDHLSIMARTLFLLTLLAGLVPCRGQMLSSDASSKDNKVPPVGASGSPSGKQKTTLVVPRSNNIQIAFAGNSDDPQTGLHVDLLRLYKEVMEEILQRNKLIHTVQTLLEKTALIDGLVDRVQVLEDRGDSRPYLPPLSEGDADRTDDDLSNSVAYESYLDNIEPGQNGNYDWDVLFRELQNQQRSLRALHETRRKDERILHDTLGRVTQLSAEVDHLRLKLGEQHDNVAECRRQVTDYAQTMEGHANQLVLLDSSVEVLDAKTNKLSLDLQWHGFKVGMQENATDALKKDFMDLQDQVLGDDVTSSFGGTTLGVPQGQLQDASLTQLQEDVASYREDLDDMFSKVQVLREDLGSLHGRIAHNTSERLERLNESLWSSIGVPGGSVHQLVEDTSTQLYNLLHRLNATQRGVTKQTDMQQKQLDNLSLDIERLKDEAEVCTTKIADSVLQIQFLKDYNLHGRRDREKLRRKFEKLQREVREVIYAGSMNPGGGDVEDLSRRSTRAAEPTMYPELEEGSFPVTDAAEGSGQEVPMATLPVSSGEEEVIPDRRVQETSGEEEEDLDTNETTELTVKKNCSISGFGNRRVIRLFKRILTGAWMRDPTANDGAIYMLRNNVKVTNIREYANERRLANNTVTRIHHLPFRCTGTGHVVYRGALYCNKYESNRIVRYDLQTERVSQARLRDAGFNNTFPYASGALTDIDLAVDEHGLWAIYSTKAHEGNIVVAALDPIGLQVEREWVTRFLKASTSNAFMACGRLYATQYHTDRPVDVVYIYDTASSQEIPVEPGRIVFHVTPPDIQTSLNYDPGNSRLYAWVLSKDWDGLIVTYDVFFPMT